jgi:glycosyltransferase involved in cell wall biosynthesis
VAALILSVVIPVWNEAPLIEDAIVNARRLGDEVIVVDGGSPDGTADIARRSGVKVIQAAKGAVSSYVPVRSGRAAASCSFSTRTRGCPRRLEIQF